MVPSYISVFQEGKNWGVVLVLISLIGVQLYMPRFGSRILHNYAAQCRNYWLKYDKMNLFH